MANTSFLFLRMDMVVPFLIVIPSQSISLVKKWDFSALTKIPASSKVVSKVRRSANSSGIVSAAKARSSICVAIFGRNDGGIILLSMVEDT